MSDDTAEWGEYQNVPPMGIIERVIYFLVYSLCIYKILPWKHGGRKIFALPTLLWVERHHKGTWMPFDD